MAAKAIFSVHRYSPSCIPVAGVWASGLVSCASGCYVKLAAVGRRCWLAPLSWCTALPFSPLRFFLRRGSSCPLFISDQTRRGRLLEGGRVCQSSPLGLFSATSHGPKTVRLSNRLFILVMQKRLLGLFLFSHVAGVDALVCRLL